MTIILDRLYNFHWVTPEVARSAQPYLGFYGAFLRAHKLRTIVNLRGENSGHAWWRQEKRIAEMLGVRQIDVRMSSRHLPARKILIELLEAFECSPRPLLIKCSGGQDRTGLAAAIYLMHVRGTEAHRAAEAQLASWPYLHFPKRGQRWLKHFPAFAYESAGDTAFDEWLRNTYSPQAFAEWLGARGERESFHSLQVLGPAAAKP